MRRALGACWAVALSAAALVGCGDEEEGAIPPITEMMCDPGSEVQGTTPGQTHLAIGEPVTYNDAPPSQGPHWGQWIPWGRWDDPVPPEYWVHNLEHGGLVLLYNCPEGCPTLRDSLEGWARTVPDDDGGPFRWILTPYADMPTPVAAVAWGWSWQAGCVMTDELDAFRAARYRKAPEDIATDGSGRP